MPGDTGTAAPARGTELAPHTPGQQRQAKTKESPREAKDAPGPGLSWSLQQSALAKSIPEAPWGERRFG